MPVYHLWQTTSNHKVLQLKPWVRVANRFGSAQSRKPAVWAVRRTANGYAQKVEAASQRRDARVLVLQCKESWHCRVCRKAKGDDMTELVVGTPEWEARQARIAEVKGAYRRAQEVISAVINPAGGDVADFCSEDVMSAKEMLDIAIEWLEEHEY